MRPVHKKWRLLRAWLSRHPVWCAWQVTYKCNFRCSFCHYWNDPAGGEPEQTVAQFAEGSAKLARLGSLMISLAGGEPLLRGDIVQVVRELGKFHFPFLTTNGWHASRQIADELFDAGLWGVSVSIDYADPARHDRQRGMAGAFDRAVAAINHFVAARRHRWQRVNLMSVLVNDNLDQMEPLTKLAAAHGASFMVQPYSRRKTGSKRFYNREDRIGPFMLDLKRRHRNVMSNPYFLSKFDEAFNGGVPGCRAGRAFFNIDSSGDIAKCVEERSRPIANLYGDEIRTIVQRLRDSGRHNTCQDCWYNCRGEIESLYTYDGLLSSLPSLLFDLSPHGTRATAPPR